jgi:hypothetical protein
MTSLQARVSTLVLVLALVLSVGCASAPRADGTTTSATKDHVTPPVRLRAGPSPELREEVRLTIEVLIDAEGIPDLRTLKVTGKGAGSAHAAIEDWIRTSAFTPGKRNGVAVPAVYKTGLQTRIQRVH